MAKAQIDQFANRAYGTVTETAANTITLSQIHFGTSIREKVVLVIHAIDWFIGQANINKILDEDDGIKMCISRSGNITDIQQQDPNLVASSQLHCKEWGTPANAELYTLPIIKQDWSTWPGGGLIVPSDPIYVGAEGVSLASAITVAAAIYFTWKNVTPQEYWELVETMRVIQ